MSFYSNLAAVSTRLLKSKGKTVTFTRTTGLFDPILGQKSAIQTTTITGYGASFNYNTSEIDETLIKSGDIRFLFEPVLTPPEVGDTIPIDGNTYTVKGVKKTKPADIILLYECNLRR